MLIYINQVTRRRISQATNLYHNWNENPKSNTEVIKFQNF
jgi:hypothetical protein